MECLKIICSKITIYHIIIIALIVYIYFNRKLPAGFLNSKTTLYLFQRPDCPYCAKMEGQWNSVEQELKNSDIKVRNININESKNAQIKEDFNISTVPHIVKHKPNGEKVVYTGARTKKDILKWVNQ